MDSNPVSEDAVHDNARTIRRRRKKKQRKHLNRETTSNNDNVETEAEAQDSDVTEVLSDVNIVDNSETYETDQKLEIDAIPKFIPKNNDFDEPEYCKEINSQISMLENTRPLPADAITYKLETFEKRRIYIFNHMKVPGYTDRHGTEKDVEYLQKVFGKLNFEIMTYTDLTEEEIFDKLNETRSIDFSHYGCLGVAVLTHGSDNGSLMSKDMEYKEGRILNYFKSDRNPSLATKPKFLIVQACRGGKMSEAAQIRFQAGKVVTDFGDEVQPYTIPVEADILLLHSSYYGNTSFRNPDEGSWFIQTLCTYIEKHSQELDLESIMKLVKRDVAIGKQYDTIDRGRNEVVTYKQMPILTSTLCRDLHLKSFEGDSDNKIKGVKGKESLTQTDSMDSAPEKCFCVDIQYKYNKHCLDIYVKQQQEDTVAENVWKTANDLEKDDNFKETLSKLISPLLKDKNIICKNCKLGFDV